MGFTRLLTLGHCVSMRVYMKPVEAVTHLYFPQSAIVAGSDTSVGVCVETEGAEHGVCGLIQGLVVV
jgi:hypothetical protein